MSRLVGFGRAVLAMAVAMMFPGIAAAQTATPTTAEEAIRNARIIVPRHERCAEQAEAAAPGEIVVCGSDTEKHRLSKELRDRAGVRSQVRDSRVEAPANGRVAAPGNCGVAFQPGACLTTIGMRGRPFHGQRYYTPPARNDQLEQLRRIEAARAAEADNGDAGDGDGDGNDRGD